MDSHKKIKVTALVTARGKNTLKKKHLILVNKKPLVWYPINIAKKCTSIDDYYISSDDKDILKLGEDSGYETIVRPDNIANSTALHVEAITHALSVIKSNHNYTPDILVVLLGNAVYFKPEWIDEGIDLLMNDENISAAVPVYAQNDHHPYRAKYIDDNGFLQTYFDFSKKKVSTNRQDLRDNYFLCHNFWVLRVSKSIQAKEGQQPWAFMGNNIRPVILDGGPCVHEKKDIDSCEIWLNDNK